MKKIIGVALILVVVLFALPFVVRQAQDTGQDPQPTVQEEAGGPGRCPGPAAPQRAGRTEPPPG